LTPASECNIETEGCGVDPEHGVDDLGCFATAAWGIEVEVNVSFKCHEQPTMFEAEVEMWRVEDGKYHEVYLKIHVWKFESQGAWGAELGSCSPGKWYRAWLYQRVWLFGVAEWSDAGTMHENKQCFEQPNALEPSESAGIEGDENQSPVP
jgi:hypothetical protein